VRPAHVDRNYEVEQDGVGEKEDRPYLPVKSKALNSKPPRHETDDDSQPFVSCIGEAHKGSEQQKCNAGNDGGSCTALDRANLVHDEAEI
jgi:hypothetical protein